MRTKLITGLLALVIAAVAAISISSVWVLRSYLTSQDDSQLKSVYTLINSQGLNPLTPGEAYQLHGILIAVQEPRVPLSASGQQPGYGGDRQLGSLPSVPASELWAIATQITTTVSISRNSGAGPSSSRIATSAPIGSAR